MSWQRYTKELMVLGALLLMLGAFYYKMSALNSQSDTGSQSKASIAQIQEVLALKEIWVDKKLAKKLEKLKKILPVSKVKWHKKGKKIDAYFKGLTARELNTIITKIFNLPISITKLNIDKKALVYNVEFKCKW